MRTPSRKMPKYQAKPLSLGEKLLSTAFVVALGIIVVRSTVWQLLFVASVCAVIWYWSKLAAQRMQHRLETLAASRPHHTICDFARSFDCRSVDTWVIRAVYEEVQEELQLGSPHFPVCASDGLASDLQIDPEDLDLSLVPAIAERAGRSLAHGEANPYWGKVKTVADLVLFFNGQPRRFLGV